MAHVSRACAESQKDPVFLCDFSPPRGADRTVVEQVRDLPVDFICVAYSPGKTVRVDPIAMAYVMKEAGKDAIFTLSCRDANKLALQNNLLGAHLLGLENVLVLKGDDFTERDLERVRNVSDYTPTGLIAAIKDLNQGVDYRGLKLRTPTNFCVGATVDLGRPMEAEAALVQRKVEAGADFLVTQPIYETSLVGRFHQVYHRITGGNVPIPIFYGLQVLDREGVMFGDVPAWVREDLDRGRSGTDIALEQLYACMDAGMRMIYLVPPILKGGRRDYDATCRVLVGIRGI